ncbi:uncharacterized protein LOC135394636 isoform X2 [Ornithodoros turicata]|uniref:Uncharacterized protein n=1 Tax=Ornithodoros turicata TaxID=34597 RepID=A0A2R5LBS2_9ACAR
MNSVMEGLSSVLNPEEEMRLLKDKVRELELQNKQLKNMNQPQSPNKKEATTKDIKQAKNMSMSDEGNEKMSETESVESLGILDVDQLLEASSDETWLTDGPATCASDEVTLAPFRWSNIHGHDNKDIGTDTHVNKVDNLLQIPRKGYDTRTFTRPRKRRPTLEMKTVHTFSTPAPMPDLCEGRPNATVHVTSAANNTAEDKPVAPVEPQPPLVDVHEIARLQEESLKQNSPMSTPKRSSVSSLRSLDSRHDSDTESLHDATTYRVYPDGDRDSRARTPPLPPPPAMKDEESSSAGSSPYGSSSSLHRMSLTTTRGATRRSFPNLSKALNGASGIAVTGSRASSTKLRQPLTKPCGGISSSQQELRSIGQLEQSKLGRRLPERPPVMAARPSSVPDRRQSLGQPGIPSSKAQGGRRSLGTPSHQRLVSPSQMPAPARMASASPALPQKQQPKKIQEAVPVQASATALKTAKSGLPRFSRVPQPTTKRF